MYKNRAKQREANKRASKKYRTKKGMTEQGMTGVTEKALRGVTSPPGKLSADGQGITPPIINALLDSKKRRMLEFVSQEIQRKSLPGENLFYGVNGFDFTEIPELLRITANLV